MRPDPTGAHIRGDHDAGTGRRDEHVHAVMVGSGFGGAVAAYRLAEAGRAVVLLERGRVYPPGGFARTPAQMGRNFWDPGRGLHELFDVWSFRGLDAIVASGLGGGSLIYANVPGADLWRDTTTLPVRLFAGHLPPDAPPDDQPLVSGVLTLDVTDFMRQLTTFRADGDQPARALERFGRLFLGELWQVYGPALGRVT